MYKMQDKKNMRLPKPKRSNAERITYMRSEDNKIEEGKVV